jgi:mono/diheme cytochrome c family protein
MHALLLPALTVLFILLHVRAFGRAREAELYSTRIPGVDRTANFSVQVFFNSVCIAAAFTVLIALAVSQPAWLGPRANPLDAAYLARPDWYFLPFFRLSKLFPGEWTFVAGVIPVLLLLVFFLLPLIDRSAERHPFRRPIASTGALALVVAFAVLIVLAKRDDGAFLSTDEVQRLIAGTSDQAEREPALARATLDRQAAVARDFLAQPFQPHVSGAAVVARRTIPTPPPAFGQCVECHGDLGGNNGLIAPDLISIGDRYNKEQLSRLLVSPEAFNISGMASFGDDKMSRDERTGLIDYLISLAQK